MEGVVTKNYINTRNACAVWILRPVSLVGFFFFLSFFACFDFVNPLIFSGFVERKTQNVL